VDVIEADPRAGKRKRKRNLLVDVSGSTCIRRPVGYRRYARDLPQKYLIHERRRKAYQLKVGGLRNFDIGLHLHADPAINVNGVAEPGGYGWQNYARGAAPLTGENLRVTVSKDLAEGLKQAAKYEALAREEYVQLEADRYERVQAMLWNRAAGGDMRAVEQLIRLFERRAKLLGLDAPEQVEQTIDQTVTHQFGVQPDYNPEFAEKMFSALAEIGVIEQGLPALGEGETDATGQLIADAEVVRHGDNGA